MLHATYGPGARARRPRMPPITRYPAVHRGGSGHGQRPLGTRQDGLREGAERGVTPTAYRSGMPDERLALIYAELQRTLASQSATLDELRGRAATILQAAAIVTGFLGVKTYSDDPGALGALAAAAFVVVAIASVVVLWPTGGWCFTLDPLMMLEDLQAGAYGDEGTDAMYSFVIERGGGWITSNDEKLRTLLWAVIAAVASLGAEAALLMAALATN